MKMLIWKAPTFLSPLLRRLFSGRNKKKYIKLQNKKEGK